MKKIAVVILNYNGRHFLEQFLEILINKTPQVEVVVIDNASTDLSVPFLSIFGKLVKVVQLDRNYGFAGGYNRGLKQVTADYYILMNSDVEITSGWLDQLIEILEKDEAVAACQPKILDYNNRKMFEYAGAAGGFIDHLGYPFCKGRLFQTIEEDTGQFDQPGKIFWASGACLAIKAEAFNKIGGFDEDFFAHMEEIDLCWRLQLSGYQIWYAPKSVVYHVGGGTLSQTSPRKTYLNFRNGLSLLVKNLPARELVWKLPVRMILDGIAAVKFLIHDGFSYFIAVIRAHLHFYVSFFKDFRKRRLVKHGQSLETIMPRSLVWAYYIKKIRKYEELNF